MFLQQPTKILLIHKTEKKILILAHFSPIEIDAIYPQSFSLISWKVCLTLLLSNKVSFAKTSLTFFGGGGGEIVI